MKTKFSLFGLLLITLVSLTSMDTPKQKLTGDCKACTKILPVNPRCNKIGGGWLVKK